MPAHTLCRRTFATFLAALPALAAARPASDVLLARDAPAGIDPAGFLVSEKYDGVRALWDGQALRFRSGLPIPAPAWFTSRLPAQALDGELWLGRGQFEPLSGGVRRQSPDDAVWTQVRYMIFELPRGTGDFAMRVARIEALLLQTAWSQLQPVKQRRVHDAQALQRLLNDVVRGGGEGLMLHRADALYETGRSDVLLKLKPLQDAEATVLGHMPGQGRHAGRLGALQVRTPQGVEFFIGTGLSDAQRADPPPVGAVVTYRYRGNTETGVPRFASFLRVHDAF